MTLCRSYEDCGNDESQLYVLEFKFGGLLVEDSRSSKKSVEDSSR